MIGYAGSENSPYLDDNWQYQYSANATWVKGNHTFRFGGDIVRQALNRFEAGNGSGTFAFGGGPTTHFRRAVAQRLQHRREFSARSADVGVDDA